MMLFYIDLKHYINLMLWYSINFYINLRGLYIKLLIIKIVIHNEFIKFLSKNPKNLLKKIKRILNMIQIVFMMIIIIISQKAQKIILIIIIMIIRNQKLISSTLHLLLSIFIIFIKRFIDLVIISFDISNKIVEKKFWRKFQIYCWLFLWKLMLLSKYI